MAEPAPIRLERTEAREPDAELIRGLREGSPEAYAVLRRRLGPALYRYAAVRLLGDAQAAEDLTVRALADAVMNIGGYDAKRASLSSWMYGIMRRQIQRELARRRRRKTIPLWAQVSLEAAAESTAGGDVAAESAQRIDAQRQVAALARVLSALEFEVLVLSCAEGLSAPEIARLVGRSQRAIHSLLHRAKQKARNRLIEDER